MRDPAMPETNGDARERIRLTKLASAAG